MKRIVKQQAVLKCYKEFLEDDKEQLKRELIKAIQDIPTDELVNVEERESCWFLTINSIFNP
jgi:hypothetical protein